MINSKIKNNFLNSILAGIVLYIIYIILDWCFPKSMPLLCNIGLKIVTFKINLIGLLILVIFVFVIYKIIHIISFSKKPFKIIKATYGTDNKHADVTKRLNNCIVGDKLEIHLTNSVVGIDPVYGVKKYAHIKYKNCDKISNIKVKEHEPIKIP